MVKEYLSLLTKIKTYYFFLIDVLFLHTRSGKFCYILVSGVNINLSLCVKYKIFVFHRSICTEKLPLKTDTA